MRDAFALPVLPRAGSRGRGGRAGSDARLLRQQQGRRLSHRQLGALPRGARRWSTRSRRARRRAAALPRPRRHGRPRRRAELRGDPRAAAGQRRRPAPHHRAGRDHRQQVRRSASSAGAISRRWSRRRCEASLPTPSAGATARPPIEAALDELCGSTRIAPIARWSTRRRASSATSAPRRRSPRSPSSTSAAGPRRARRSTRIEDLRAIPWVFSWGQCRLMLPGWYGFGIGGRRVADAAQARRGCALLQRDARALAVLPQRALQHGHGARQDRPRDRLALRRAGARRGAARRDLRRAFASEWQRSRDAVLAITGQTQLLERQPDARAQHPQPLSLSRPAESPAGRAAASATAPGEHDERITRAAST